jgi:hypothetical protein
MIVSIHYAFLTVISSRLFLYGVYLCRLVLQLRIEGAGAVFLFLFIEIALRLNL